MSNVWQSFVATLRTIVMVPSLALFPSVALPSPKHVKDAHRPNVVITAYDRDMDDFLEEVKRLVEGPLKPTSLFAMSGKLQEQFKSKLQSSNICMLPSYNHTLPTGHERGAYLALDVGGSTFRVALVKLNGQEQGEDCMRIVKIRNFKIDNAVRALEGHSFFDWMAEKIGETLVDPEVRHSHPNDTIPMGLAWSFPVEQTSSRGGVLLEMGKGFRATSGVLGRDLGELIMKACRKKDLDVRMDAIINDGAATLLSRAYQDSSTRLALILGTGTNAAIHLPVSLFAQAKFGNRPQSWYDNAKHVVVNTEVSMFGKNILPSTRWDEYLNKSHTHPDFQPLEYFIGGRYLGEIVRLVLVEAIQTVGLFGGVMPERFMEPYALETGTLAVIEADDSPDLLKGNAILQSTHPLRHAPSIEDMRFVRRVCKAVTHRAAAYLATNIHALWCLRNSAEGVAPSDAGHVTVGCNGSVIEKYPCFRTLCQKYLDDLTTLSGASTSSLSLEPAIESAIFGAAVAAGCIEQGQ